MPESQEDDTLEFLQFTSSLRHIRTFVGLETNGKILREAEREREELGRTVRGLTEDLETVRMELKAKEKECIRVNGELGEKDKECLLLKEALQQKDQEYDTVKKEYDSVKEALQQKDQENQSLLHELQNAKQITNHHKEAQLQKQIEDLQLLIDQERSDHKLSYQVLKLELVRLRTDFALAKEDLRLKSTQACKLVSL